MPTSRHGTRTVAVMSSTYLTNREPSAATPAPLPDMIPLQGPTATDLHLPVILSLDELNKVLGSESIEIDTGIGTKLNITGLQAEVGQNGRLNLKLDLAADQSRLGRGVTGSIWVTGKPVIHYENQTLGFTEVELTVETQDKLTGAAAWLLQGILVKGIEAELRIDLNDYQAELDEEVQKAIANADLPDGLDLREAMILGTAGFTAALGLLRMVENHQVPDMGPLAVTGASGGVGSLAVDIFSAAGFQVHAISGKADQSAYLEEIGASQVLGRDALQTARPLESARFGGGLDNVGGPMLASLLAQTRPYGNVGSAGLAATHQLDATVMPFILRGVSLLGVASTDTPPHHRDEVWRRLASDWKPQHLQRICTREATLEDLPEVFGTMLSGDSLGRTLVTLR